MQHLAQVMLGAAIRHSFRRRGSCNWTATCSISKIGEEARLCDLRYALAPLGAP